MRLGLRGGGYAWDGNTDESGAYSTHGLAAGTYYAVTDLYSSDYLDELYQELPCDPPYGCDPTSGTPIEIADGAITSGIGFTLSLDGAISGSVTDRATGVPITSGDVHIYDATGDFVAERHLDGSGVYRAGGLPAGTYFARTDMYYPSPYVEELYDDFPCPNGFCDPTAGIVVEDSGLVGVPGVTTGIDFTLEPSIVLFADGFESGDLSSWSVAGGIP